MTICLTRLDAEQAVCAQVLPLHYNALPPPFSGSASGQGFVESDGASGHKKNVLMMITMTGFLNSHERSKIPVLYILRYTSVRFTVPCYLCVLSPFN
jgi:hypothetical protein